jgi:hypothetical protein
MENPRGGDVACVSKGERHNAIDIQSKRENDMSPIETIAKPRRNRITVPVPKEYGTCSFQVILVPLGNGKAADVSRRAGKRLSFVDALLSCPKLGEGETLDVTRDSSDFGRDVVL